MPAEPVVVANRLEFKFSWQFYSGQFIMAKLILHTNADVAAIIERRMQEDFALTYQERLKKAFELMRLSLLFKKDAIKKPANKGIVLKFK